MAPHSGQNLALSAAIIIAGAMISGSIWWSATQLLPEARQIAEADAQILPAARQIAEASARISEAVQRLPAPNSQAETAAPPPPAVDAAKITVAGEPFVGDPNAPVMGFWFDYQCPFCREVETTVVPKLVADYVKAGKLRIVFKDFQFLGPDSQTAGLAARAVWEVAPDKFYDWHSAMFAKQDGENSGWGSKADILALTKTIPGIDAAKVEQLMTDHAAAYQKSMGADMVEGNALGINGTPGTIVGKQLLEGAQPYLAFKAAVEATLDAPK